jgi:transcription termination factor 2
VDPHWNPAIEAQACDRAYRIGQTKDVLVTRMVQTRKNGDETIEQVIRAIQNAKQRSMDAMFPKPPAAQVLRRLTK